jgi:hypothetical protein
MSGGAFHQSLALSRIGALGRDFGIRAEAPA